MIFAEIITIGEEILIGQVVDTNSAWIGQQLNDNGIHVFQITSISDKKEQIISALKTAEKRTDVIIMTGGLGPTNDDITKNTLAEYFNTSLEFNEIIFNDLKEFFSTRGRGITETNRSQAFIPKDCIPLRNFHGTAPGMWFEKNGKVIVSLPGVPYEMKAMIEKDVITMLHKKYSLPFIIHITILTIGIAEAALSDLLKNFEAKLPGTISLAYLPSPGFVRLRLSGSDKNSKNLNEKITTYLNELKEIVKPYIFGYDSEQLQEIVGKLLREKNKTLATGESCTGGRIAHLIISVPGSSDYFIGSVIAYSNDIKENILKVKKEDLISKGAVSQTVVEQMAHNVRELYQTDYAIATSGIAGPTGGSSEKPIGTTWIAVASKKRIISNKFHFGENRERNIEKASLYALNMLRQELMKD